MEQEGQQRQKQRQQQRQQPRQKQQNQQPKQNQKPNQSQGGNQPRPLDRGKSNPLPQKQQQQQQPQQPPATVKPEKPVSEISRLFSHIPMVHKRTSRELLEQVGSSQRDLIHPALLEFALQTEQDLSVDEDQRTRVFMEMMMQQIQDEPVDKKVPFVRTLFSLISRTKDFLDKIRLTPIGISNATQFIQAQIKTENHVEPEELRSDLLYRINFFIEDKIDDVAVFIAKATAEMIMDGDVVLTYGWSHLIYKALKQAAAQGKTFRVIVVDSRPSFNSRRLVERLSGIDVRYVLISGLSYVMPEATKVLIEPCGILSNNAAHTPIGTSMIAMVAHECGVPVIFVCPSYRFGSDVRIDALSKNEIVSPELIPQTPISSTEPTYEYLALTYDVTPGQYVDVVICELGNIPVNSISTNIKYIQDQYTMFSRPKPK